MPDRPTISRRRLLGMLAAGPVLAACGDTQVPGLNAPAAAPHIKIGVIWPQSGPNAAFGTDIKRGWDLWMRQNKGNLGQYVADVVTADEGTTPQSAVAAVQKLLQTDKVDVVVGMVDTGAALAVVPLMEAAKRLFVVAGAGGVDLTRRATTAYTWRTSFSDPQLASPMGTQLAQTPAREGTFVVAPSDDQGAATIAGFQVPFESGGGRIAGTARPVLGTTDFLREIAQIRGTQPKATYCALPPADAVAFVKQYAQAGLAPAIPLYGSGPVTEGDALTQEGPAADGVQTTLHYSDQLATKANTTFVAAYRAAYQASPSCYAVHGYDAGNVLNHALGEEVQLDGNTLGNQLGKGDEYDSPRGTWKFDQQGPLQHVYLRKVQNVRGTPVNAVLFDMGISGQPLG